MIELGKFIDQELKKVHDRVYHEQAPQGAELPFVVYTFPNSTENFEREDFVLEINIWGMAPGTLDIEQLTDDLDKHLHRLHHYENGKLQVSIYRVNRIAVPDPNRDIRRRQLRYQCHTYL